MGVRNVVTPKINVPAQRGWCLKYVDDTVKAPSRKPTAKASYEQEKKNGNIRTFDLPKGVWLPGYLSFTKGAFVNYGHVFWAYKHSDGRVEIHDSESASGARKPYGSLAELIAWFGAYAPKFIGWTMGIDGVHIAVEFEDPKPTPPAPKPEPKPQPKPEPAPAPKLKVGDTVVPTRLVSFDGVPLRQYDANYQVTEVKGNRAVLMARGYVWAAMRTEDLRKV